MWRWLAVRDLHCCKHLVRWLRVAGTEVLGKEQAYVGCTLKAVVWTVQECVLLCPFLHWYTLHHLFSEEFLGKFHLCDSVFLWDTGSLGWFHKKISWHEELCSPP